MKFFYTARSKSGETITGEQEALSEADLTEFVKSQGASLLFFEKQKEGGLMHYDVGRLLDFFRGVPRKEKIIFARNLAVMINAGIPLTRSLQTLARQSASSVFSDVILDIAGEIAEGKGFGETLKKYPDVFSTIFINMITVGETTGNLDEVLTILAGQMEKDNETRSKVIGSLIYPAVIITAMLGIGIFMMIYVVPQITGVFEEMNVELPFMTKMIISISKFLQKYWYLGAGGLVLMIVGIKWLFKIEIVKKIFHFILLRAPIAGDIVRKVNSARISRNMSALLKSGVSLTRTLEILSDTTDNYFFSKSLQETKIGVEQGLTLNKVLSNYPELYPPMVLEMVAIGEETGALTDLLIKIAEFFEREVEQLTKNMSSIIEPVLMVVIGAAVGFFAVSMIQPMYSLTNSM